MLRKYRFMRLHIPTASVSESEQEFASPLEFFKALNAWNAQQFGRWQYWTTTGVPHG